MRAVRKHDQRLDRHPGFVVGFLDSYFDRAVAGRRHHDPFLVATATFVGLTDVSVFIETPNYNLNALRSLDFWHLVMEHLEGRRARLMPAIVYFVIRDDIYWVEICDDPGSVRARKASVQAAIDEAADELGSAPIDRSDFI